MSLRSLINTRIIVTVILIMLVSGLMAIWQARHNVEEEVESSFNLALQMIDLGFSHLRHNVTTERQWLAQISRIQQTRHLRISLVHESGQEVEWFQHFRSDANEELEDQPPAWFVKAVTTQYPKAEYNINLIDGREKQIVIRADPIDEISEAWGESVSYFWSVVIMMGVIFFVINLVFHSMLRAVKRILSGLKQVESGQYTQRLPAFQISEFNAIASEINNLSEALQKSRESNQALARHTMQIQETERRNLSRELHDEMGQSLTAIKAMAVASKQPDADTQGISESIVEICNHLSGVVRSMMRTLHPLSLADLGLEATLSDLISEWRRRHPGLHIELDYDESLDQLAHETAIHVYRIVQECLTNVVRHADASEVSVEVRLHSAGFSDSGVWLRVSDNGQGGDTEGDGFGIRSMRERIENMGGQFNFTSVSGEGVRVTAWMPYSERVNDE